MGDFNAFQSQSQLRAELRASKHNDIVRCAAQHFAERGYERTSLTAIADELGITKTALYHYVASKKALLLECYRQTMDRILKITHDAEGMHAPALDKLNYALRHYAMLATAGDNQYLWLDIAAVLKEEKTHALMAERDEIDRRLRGIISACVKQGDFRSDTDTKLAYFHMIGAVNWMAVWYKEGGTWSREFVCEKIAQDVIRGYLA